MKTALSFPIALWMSIIVQYGMAGSLQILDPETGIKLIGDSLTLSWNPATGDTGLVSMEQGLALMNSGSQAISIGVKKAELNPLQKDVSHSFCFAGLCFDSSVHVSPYFEDLPAGGTDLELETGFKGDYNFNTESHRPGVDRIAYVFYDKNNPKDSTKVIVRFNTLANANSILPKGSNRFPITQNRFSITQDYTESGNAVFQIHHITDASGPMTFQFYGATGEKIRISVLTRTVDGISFATGTMPPGIYFLIVLNGNRMMGVNRVLVNR